MRLVHSDKVHEVNNYQGAQFGPASLKAVPREYYAGRGSKVTALSPLWLGAAQTGAAG